MEMETSQVTLRCIKPAEGKTLTDGNIYSKEVWLGVGDTPDRWREIDDSEVPQPEPPEEPHEPEMREEPPMPEPAMEEEPIPVVEGEVIGVVNANTDEVVDIADSVVDANE